MNYTIDLHTVDGDKLMKKIMAVNSDVKWASGCNPDEYSTRGKRYLDVERLMVNNHNYTLSKCSYQSYDVVTEGFLLNMLGSL